MSASLVHAAELPLAGAHAQPPALVPAMSLPEALHYARTHHPDLLASRARAWAVASLSDVPRARWLPAAALGLEVLVGTTNNTTASFVGLPGVALPRIGATRATAGGSFAPEPSTLAAVGVSQELFDSGRIAAQTALAETLARAERFGAESERLTIELGVAQSYFAVLAAREIVKASDQAYERARTHRDEADAKVSAGLRSPIELTRASADLARYEVGQTRARGGLRLAQSGFAAAVGSPEDALDVRGEPPELLPLPPLPIVLAAATERQPEIAERRERIEAASAERRAIAKEGLPEAQLNAGFSGREGGAAPSSGPPARFGGWLPDVPNWDVAVTLAWPFLDPVRAARERSAGARERVARAELAVARSDIVARARDAYTRFELARQALGALERESAAAQANYAQEEARFRGGLATTVELADAEALRTQAEIELAVGRFEVFRARARLSQLMAEGQ